MRELRKTALAVPRIDDISAHVRAVRLPRPATNVDPYKLVAIDVNDNEHPKRIIRKGISTPQQTKLHVLAISGALSNSTNRASPFA